MESKVYYQPNLSDEQWYENKNFNTTDVFESFHKAKEMFPNNEIGAYSGDDIPDKVFIDLIHLKCSYCSHIEYYECEEHLFQGEMCGLSDGTIICEKCLNN